jgi:hypothetical protein
METIRGTLVGALGAFAAIFGWALVFEQIDRQSWYLTVLAAAVFGVFVGIMCGLPHRVSDQRDAEAAMPLPIVALLLGAVAAFGGDLAVANLRAGGGLDLGVDAILAYTRTRSIHQWADALVAAGAATAVCHRMIQTASEKPKPP